MSGGVGPGAGTATPVGAGAGAGAGAGPGDTVGAIVLTGGRASRLGGVDKARLTVSGRPMVETVLRAARAVAGAVVTVGPGGDTREEPPRSGPVAGIAAGLAALPAAVDLVVVVACDLPDLDADTLRALVDAARTSGAPAAVGVDPAGRDQYLLAAWDRRALAARVGRLEASGGVAGRPVRALYGTGAGGVGGSAGAGGNGGAGGRGGAGGSAARPERNNDDVDLLRVPVGAPARDVDTWSDLAGRGPVALAHVGPVLAAGVGPVPAERRAPLGAIGAVLAAPLVAAEPMPRGRVSAMDGYALSGPGPWRLTGAARRAGDDSAAALLPGCAAPIATGALAPAGTDRVLRHELVEVGVEVAEPLVTARAEAAGVDDLRPVGEDWPAGHGLAPTGTTLDAALASVALSAGVTAVAVRGPVRARLVTTGDEVLPSDAPDPLPPGRIRDTVGLVLGMVLARAGFAAHGPDAFRPPGPHLPEHCPDTAAAFEELLRRPRVPGEVLVLVGATGRGVADHLRPALEAVGARIVLDGVRVRPGGSQIVATLPGDGVLLGLPGNPLAAVSAAATTGRALVDALTGRRRTPVLAPVDAAVLGHPARSRLLPARPDGEGGWAVADRVRTAHLADLAGASHLALVPETSGPVDQVELIDWI